MTGHQPDDDLHAAFQAERAAEHPRVPSYAMVARGKAKHRPAPKTRWLRLSGAVAVVVIGIALVLLSQSNRDIERARRVMEGESPTASLLPAPSVSLLDSIPRFGSSVLGSPLRSLDPGGPLGPPLSRSPRI